MDDALQQWSGAVETAVDEALSIANRLDPVNNVLTTLHSSFKGRCRFRKTFSERRNFSIRSARHGGYTPPSGVFSLKSRLRVRQVRRLKSLLRRLKSLRLHATMDTVFSGLLAVQREWDSIPSAKGYGNKWSNWILAFEVVAYLPLNVPDIDTLDSVTQITELDCNSACYDEARCRRDRFRATIQFDHEHDFSKLSYKIVKAKKTPQLQDVPVERQIHAKLLRSVKGSAALLMDSKLDIPQHAKLLFNEAELEFLGQSERKAFSRTY